MSQNSISLDHWVDLYAEMIYRLAYARTLNKMDAEDIVQEVYLKYLRYEPQFNDEEHAKAWFIKVTCQQSRELGRKKQREQPLTEEILDYLQEDTSTSDASHDDLVREMSDAMAKLSPKDREILHLHYFEDYSTESIAGLLGKKSGAVRMHLTRARRALSEVYQDHE